MGKYVADSVTIASIWPGKLKAISKFVGPDPNPINEREPGKSTGRCTNYELVPVKRGDKPFCLEVADAFETNRDWIQSAEQGRQVVHMAPVDCRQIAENLVREWTGNFVDVPAGAGLGIRIIRGGVPHQDELQEMRGELSAFCNWRFQEASRHARLNEWKEILRPLDEICAEWIGQKPAWAAPEKSGDIVACPACTTQISSKAAVCPNCRYQIKALPAQIAELNEPAEATV